MPNNGMAQCNLCVTDFSISSGGRTGVRQHQERARHAKLAKSGLYEAFTVPLRRRVGWSNLTDFLKFVGILLATQALISLAGFCVNFINICTSTNKMVGIVVYSFF